MFSVKMQQKNRINLGKERVHELKKNKLNKNQEKNFNNLELKSIGLWFESVELPLVVVHESEGRTS